MSLLVLFILLVILYFLFVYFYPIKRLKVKENLTHITQIPDLYVYSFQIHLHSQFSHDSLGKPEDITESAKKENIDFVVITDHDNDHIKHFASDRLIAGMEKKIVDEDGRVLGDLLIVDQLRVVAHPFKEKYRWRLELPEDYFFEIVDLKDAILERKGRILLFIPCVLLMFFISKRLVFETIKKLIDIKKFASLYLKMGIGNPVVGGLDHHVKVYVREIGTRFLFPDYQHSFKIMRNFLISKRKVENKENFIECLKEGRTLISFSEKPTLYWKEEGLIKILPPAGCILLKKTAEGEELYKGDSFEIKPQKGITLFLGFTYSFSLGEFYFGLKPLFLFVWKEEASELSSF